MKTTTAALAQKTVAHLTRMASICRRSNLPNIADVMEELAIQWIEQIQYDRPIGRPRRTLPPPVAQPDADRPRT